MILDYRLCKGSYLLFVVRRLLTPNPGFDKFVMNMWLTFAQILEFSVSNSVEAIRPIFG
jgi:hypothetical protein